MFSLKVGMVPVMRILAVELGAEVREALVLAVEIRRWRGLVWGVVHQMPKLAMERYIYLAGLVNESVGVTFS
jgi:hypothetical protein